MLHFFHHRFILISSGQVFQLRKSMPFTVFLTLLDSHAGSPLGRVEPTLLGGVPSSRLALLAVLNSPQALWRDNPIYFPFQCHLLCEHVRIGPRTFCVPSLHSSTPNHL